MFLCVLKKGDEYNHYFEIFFNRCIQGEYFNLAQKIKIKGMWLKRIKKKMSR